VKDNFTFEAFVLAGGKSSRMGTDKGLMDFQGRKMIEHVLQSLKISQRITIITENGDYKQFGFPVCTDIYKNCGPLGGIQSALFNSNADWNIIASCDLPFVTSDFFKFLLEKINKTFAHAIVPVHENKSEPLCALYHKSCLSEVEKFLTEKELKMHHVLKKLNTVYVEVPAHFNPAQLFRNINWPADVL